MLKASFAVNLWYEPRRVPCQGICVSRCDCQKHVNEVGEVSARPVALPIFLPDPEMISLDNYRTQTAEP